MTPHAYTALVARVDDNKFHCFFFSAAVLVPVGRKYLERYRRDEAIVQFVEVTYLCCQHTYRGPLVLSHLRLVDVTFVKVATGSAYNFA